MATPQYAYDEDPYGDNPKNRVTGERHTIAPVNGKAFNYFIPKFAPFHRRGFVLRNVVNGVVSNTPLTATTDYYFAFRYDQMILAGGMAPIYGAIVMNDPQFAGTLEAEYQTLGGQYTLSTTQIATIMANTVLDPRQVQWSAVSGAPTTVPAVPHKHNAMETMIGMDSVVDTLYVIIDQLAMGFNKAYQMVSEHMQDHNNPHRVTAQQVGVDGNGSLIPATEDEARAGVDNNKYMTSLRTYQQAQALVIPLIDAHKADKANPHGTTKAQVGLGNVDNYLTASTTEAEAAVATNRFMTPAAVKAAMLYNVPIIMQTHTDDFSNPHQVTKAQVGLGNVPNYAVATLQQAQNGTDNTTFMTPYLVAQAISSGASQGLSAHVNDKNNPHGTTKAQVGLGNVPNYLQATVAQAQAGTDNASFMTPYLVTQAITTQAGQMLSNHVTDYGNPHQVSKAQVGLGLVQNYGIATDADALAGTSNAMYMTPYLVSLMMARGSDASLTGHLNDFNNPHKVTKAQVGLDLVENYGIASAAQAIAGTDNGTYMTPYLVSQAIQNTSPQLMTDHIADLDNPHKVTKAQVGLGNVPDYPAATTADIADLTNFQALVTPGDLKTFMVGTVQGAITQAVQGVSKDSLSLGEVENMGVATLADMHARKKKYVGAQAMEDRIVELAGVNPIYTQSGDLYAAISGRYPYEYTFLRQHFIGSPWVGDSQGIRPSVVPAAYNYVWELLSSYATTPASFTGNVTVGAASALALVVAVSPRYDDTQGEMIVYAEILGPSMVFKAVDSRSGTVTTVASVPAVTITKLTGTQAWRIDKTLDTDGSVMGMRVTVGGQAITLDLATITTDFDRDMEFEPAVGFGVQASANTAYFTVNGAAWLPRNLFLVDLSKRRTAYKFNGTAWAAATYQDAANITYTGSWYYNRFNGESFGAFSESEVVPLRGKRLLSSEEITVTETYDGIKLSLAGTVKSDLALGTKDITMDI